MYVELNHINKKYGDYPASKDINFAIEKGKLVALLGPSGSGKTTILRLIAGLETPDKGDVKINQSSVVNLPPSKREIGFVFQNYALFRYQSVYDNIAFGLVAKNWAKDKVKARVSELIELIGLTGLEKRFPHELSGGQKQRVAFARALAPNPHVLLLDEPFAAVDAKIRKELRAWLKDMVKKVGITSIFVTHDHEEAIEVADEIIVTNQGKVEQQGTPLEIYRRPATPFVAQFIGQSQVISEISKLNGFEKVSSSAQAVLRPEYIELYESRSQQPEFAVSLENAKVIATEFRGSYQEITLDIKGIKMITQRSLEKALLQVGDELFAFIYRLYVFDEPGKQPRILENENFARRSPGVFL